MQCTAQLKRYTKLNFLPVTATVSQPNCQNRITNDQCESINNHTHQQLFYYTVVISVQVVRKVLGVEWLRPPGCGVGFSTNF